MNIPYVFKKCTKCGKWLVASSVNFHKHKKGKYGLQTECKKCRSEHRKKHYQANKERILKQNRQYKETHKEATAERGRRWRETHKEYMVEYSKKHYQANKEAKAEYRKKHYQENKERILKQNRQYRQSPQGQVVEFNKANKRRAKLEAQGRGITKEQWLECMSFFNWQCAYSGESVSKAETRSIDHIEPLNKGGVNEIYNLVPMYRAYNSRKQDKDMLEWYTEQPYFSQDRLNKIYEWQEYAFNKWGTDTEAQ